MLQMQEYVPEIQERLRRAGFPRFSETLMQELVLGPATSGAPNVVTRRKWLFADKANKTAVALAPDFVTLETVEYDTFDAYSEQLAAVLQVVGEAADLALSERIGLRYIDHITERSGLTLEQYVAPGLTGLPQQESARPAQSLYVATGSTDVGQFVVRLVRARGAILLPPDLQPSDLQLPTRPEGEYLLLDLDHAATVTRDFDVASVLDVFWELHDVVDGIFRSAVTPQALTAWGAEERQ